MSSKKAVVNVFIYSFFNFLQKGSAFLLIPVYTRYLKPEEYGIVGLILSITPLIYIFFTLSLDSTIVRFYFNSKGGKDYHQQLYGSINAIILIGTFGFLFLFIFIPQNVLALVFGSVPLYPYAIFTLAIAVTEPAYDINLKILRAKQSGLSYSIQHFSKFLLRTGIILILVLGFGYQAIGVLTGYVFAGIIFCLIAGYSLFHNYGLCWNTPLIKDCFKYSVPLIPNKIAAVVAIPINTVLINSLKTTSETGLFYIGSLLGSIVTLIIQGINEAYLPWCFEQLEYYNKEGRVKVIRISNTLLFFFSALALILSLFCKEIFDLVAYGDFSEAWIIFPFFAFWAVFNFVKNLWLIPLQYNKAGIKYAPIATYVNLGLTLVLSISLIPQFGIIGAGISILSSRFCSSFIMMYFSKKIEDIGFSVTKIYAYPIVFFLVSFMIFMQIDNMWLIKLFTSLIILIYGYYYTKNDIKRVFSILRSKSG